MVNNSLEVLTNSDLIYQHDRSGIIRIQNRIFENCLYYIVLIDVNREDHLGYLRAKIELLYFMINLNLRIDYKDIDS